MESTASLIVRRVPIADLHLDPANARQHGERNLEAIRASLQRFGQAEPLVVQQSTGRVIGGNGRLVAMKALGWTECDVVDVDLDDVQATALGIALNRTGELAEWDMSALGKILESLQAEGALDGVGFSTAELDELLAQLEADAAPGTVDDPGPTEPPLVPVAQSGDLWLLGDHRLLCGDSTSADDVARLMNGERATLWSSDPPYCVNYTGQDRPIHDGKPSGKDWTHVYREIDIADLGAFLDGVLDATLPHMVERGMLIEVEDKRGKHTVRKTIQGTRYETLHLRRSLIVGQAQSAQSTQTTVDGPVDAGVVASPATVQAHEPEEFQAQQPSIGPAGPSGPEPHGDANRGWGEV